MGTSDNPSTGEARRRLYEVMRQDVPFEQKVERALELGTTHLDVENGHFTRIDPQTDYWEAIASTDSADGQFPPGLVLDLGETYCRRAIDQDGSLTLHDAPAEGWAADPAFETHELHCYHGTPVRTDGDVYGTLCFVAEEPRDAPFTDTETLFAELTARLLERELDHRQFDAKLTRRTNLITVLNRVLRHNLRNSMTVIRGRAQLIADHTEGAVRQDSEAIIDRANRLIDLSEKARQLESVVVEDPTRSATDLCELLARIVDAVEDDHPDASMSLDCPEGTSLAVRPSMEAALFELVENAATHAAPDPTVTISVEPVPNAVEIHVVDDGPGLDAIEREVLVDGVERPLAHGIGLGLWLVYWIVTSHDGTVEPHVTEEGTRMTVRLPRVATMTDQTDTTPDEHTIERIQDQFRAVFEDAFDAMVITNDDGQCLNVNQSAADLLGVERDDLLGRALTDFMRDGIAFDTVREECQEAGADRRTFPVVSADGTERVVECTVSTDVIPDEHLVVMRDVTEREKRQRERQLAETIFRNTQDAIFLIDVGDEQTFRVQRVNDAYEELTGLSNDEVQGLTPREAVGEVFGAEIEARYRDCFERRETIEYAEEIPVDGENRYWETKLTPVVKDGTVTKLVGAMRDVTGRKERERELQRTTRHLETILETAGPAFIKDTDGRYQLMNTACKEVLGIDPDDDVTGYTDYDLLPDDVAEQFRADDRRVFEEGEPIEIEEQVPTPAGTKTYLTHKRPLFDEEGTLEGLCAVSTDITAHKEREREIERQKERLEEFASIVSHDLRNPLAVAKGRVVLTREACDSDHLDAVERAHARMDDLIEDLLTLARQGQQVGEREPIALADFSEECWRHVATGDATLVVDTDRTVSADRSRLKQLFENLLRNAVEHGGDDVTVTIGDLDDGFYVADDGPGIPDADRTKVFDAGYSTSGTGTGFGLRIVEQIVEAHGWDVSVTDSAEGGARFEITGVGFDEG